MPKFKFDPVRPSSHQVIPSQSIALLFAGIILAGVYAATLQTQISGSFKETSPASVLKNEYIKDVSEIQVALNVWGTIHHTGYPLFALLGNLFTIPFRVAGIEPAAAASLYAAGWGAVLLASFGLLVARLTGRPLLAAVTMLLLGTARSIWIHNVIAEVYSMSLAITALLLLVALWPAPWTGAWSLRRRVLWLALLGGIGVAHHRAVVFIAPGLLVAIWPHLRDERDFWRRTAPRALGLGVAGFLPYFYLPLRAWQHGSWVYGEPGTLRGFWTEFSGKEASVNHLTQPPSSLAALWDNITSVWTILVHEITLPGLVIGLAALGGALMFSSQRRAARIAACCALGPTLFATIFHNAVMPQAVLMPTVLTLVFGVALAAEGLSRLDKRLAVGVMAGIAGWAGVLIAWNYGYVHELVTEPTGVQTIEHLKQLPRDGKPALMLPWGPRYAAASYSRLVTGENRDLLVVNHKGDYPRLLSEGYQLYTEPETFYTYTPPWPTDYGAPSDWWTTHIGQLHLTSAAPGFVKLQNSPWLADPESGSGIPVIYGIERRDAWLTCDDQHIYLHVIWSADQLPSGDPSLFVHLTGDEPAPNPVNADSRHPVYGLYPFVQWSPGELVRDDFTLPRLPDKTQVRFGLYDQDASGQFTNYGETILPVAGCQPE
jgi:hypothetical protein